MRILLAAFYTEPRLTISVNSSGALVQYETEGYPAPVVMWKGEDGENLTDHIQTSVQSNEETGLCYVKSSYTAPNTPLSLTFILENHLLHQYLQRPVSYTGKDFTFHAEMSRRGYASQRSFLEFLSI